MTNAELIDELTEICQRQAEIIKEQAFQLEQLGGDTLEDPELEDELEELL